MQEVNFCLSLGQVYTRGLNEELGIIIGIGGGKVRCNVLGVMSVRMCHVLWECSA